MRSYSQSGTETGNYNTYNFSSRDYHGKPQNWSVIQDERGIMYFGNNYGIIEFDGEKWREIFTEKSNIVRSLAIDSKGIIYVGGSETFGFLKGDSTGNLKYISLSDQLPEKDREFVDVWKTFANAQDEIFFQTSNKLFRYKDGKFKIWSQPNPFHFSYLVNNMMYVMQLGTGLMYLHNEELKLVNGGEQFAQDKIYGMVPLGPHTIMLITRKSGLFIMEGSDPGNVVITPLKSEIDSFLQEFPVYNGLKISQDKISVGTLGGGLAIINNNGELLKMIDRSSGLQDATVYAQFLDSFDNLWLALNNGISKIDINSPLSYFNDKNNLEGTVQSISRYKGRIHAATNLGLFVLNNENQFNHYKEISAECWHLLSIDVKEKELLLVASNAGVYSVDGEKVTLITKDNSSYLHQSKRDSLRIFVGLADGLASIYFKNGGWINEGRVKNVAEDIRTIAEDEHNILWLGTYNNGLIKAKPRITENQIKEALVIKYDHSNGLGEGGIFVTELNSRIIFASPKGLYKLTSNGEETGKLFHIDESFGKELADTSRGIHRIGNDPTGNIWAISYDNKGINIGYRNKGGNWITKPFNEITDEIIHAIYSEENGITWLGGPQGIFRFDSKSKFNYSYPFHTLVRRVVTARDSALFNGTFVNDSGLPTSIQSEAFVPVIGYVKNNSMLFEFAATGYHNKRGLKYSHFLEGFDKNWSDWKNESKEVYTNLPEGDYTFHVKGLNIYGNESQVGTFHFTILPPWYRTWWAYLLYILMFAGFVWGAISISTRGLRNIIERQTAEVVKQKEEIELKNKDITDSINYAKRIQQAILPTYETFISLFKQGFILYKPKDIVSGDFYWMSEKNGICYVAAADCTGHGVPGAFMSMIGTSLLNEIVNDKSVAEPGKILDALREGIISSLKQKAVEGESKDGMDIAFCAIDYKTLTLQFAGAHNPLFIVRDGQLMEFKADKSPIGISYDPVPFTNNNINLKPGDTLYLFSDGYADQFGGPEGKKFMKKRFKELFLQINSQPILAQGKILDNTILSWRGDYEQVDDVLVIGIKI